jgi:hypothetical protein
VSREDLSGMEGEQQGRGVATAPKGKGVRIVGEGGFHLFLFFVGKGKLEHRGRRKGQGLGGIEGGLCGVVAQGEKGER